MTLEPSDSPDAQSREALQAPPEAAPALLDHLAIPIPEKRRVNGLTRHRVSTEYVVLLDDAGRPTGQAPKAEVHTSATPLHLAFSCYGFDGNNRLLWTRRAETKLTFPGVWTNTCCGHPMPGERMEEAVRRRLRGELGVSAENLFCALPDFRYRAEMNGIQENEICPVFLCRITRDPQPSPDEVAEAQWIPWQDYVRKALSPSSELSPWSVRQVSALLEGGTVECFLAQDWTSTTP